LGNINDTFFDGHYKKIWKEVIPEELTRREIDFMVPYFSLNDKSNVLDLMCGYGRHALGLASKGISVTAVDNLADYINEIDQQAKKDALPVETVQSSVLDFRTDKKFDLAICMGNSIQFFAPDDVQQIFRQVRASLRSSGKFLINSWSIAEILLKNFKEKSWSEFNDVKFLAESRIEFLPTRMEVRSVIIGPDGDTEEKNSVDYIYSINEIAQMMGQAGLKLEEVYSIPGKKKFSLGEPRAYLVASVRQ
jgi:SAM-dependent methyltransferase